MVYIVKVYEVAFTLYHRLILTQAFTSNVAAWEFLRGFMEAAPKAKRYHFSLRTMTEEEWMQDD